MFIRTGLFFFAACFFMSAQSAPLKPEQIPKPLEPWAEWVLLDHPERGCPFLYNSFEQKQCAWPARLKLDLADRQGRFSIDWTLYRESEISLPGGPKHWPLNVTVNGKPAAVLVRNEVPVVRLAAGQYAVAGDFAWDRLPEGLAVPEAAGLIDLTVNGVSVPMPAIKQRRIWLKSEGNKPKDTVQDSLDLQVFRKITDEVPLQMTALLELEVAGEQRELMLAAPLLEGFVPLRLQSPLPARLEPDGRLRLQVRPGRWQIWLDARNVEDRAALPLPVTSGEWPKEEIWSFEARPSLRVVEIENLESIDPNQTNLPPEWKSLPSYRIAQGQSLAFKVIRRGDPEAEPNQLHLNRTLWLDFDGGGYTVNDKITGLLTRGWRLDVTSEIDLGRVALDGTPQLVTQSGENGKRGVEVRKGRINLDADGRIAGAAGELGAVGWDHSFREVDADLNIPPGWRLLAASGVDNVPDSWLARWTLLDLFLVLITTLAIGRLWNVQRGALALATLVLIWHEHGAPQFVWLNILAAIALLKVLPDGKFKTFVAWYRNACWLGLVVIALPFMVAQVRTGLYPQLEKPWQRIGTAALDEGMLINASKNALPSSMPVQAPMVAEEAMMDRLETAAKPATPLKQRSVRYKISNASNSFEADEKKIATARIDPNARIQTGPGLPQWQWHKIRLSWNGSVDPGQRLKLWYSPPSVTALLNFLRVVLIFGLAFALSDPKRFAERCKSILTHLAWLLVLPALFWPSHDAFADFPDKALLDELRTRLLEAPECVPECAQVAELRLSVNETVLNIALDIHSGQNVAVPLPADYEQWFPSDATVDGEPAAVLLRRGHALWLNLPAGRHRVTLAG
ncbi:MAG: hypothetical protein ACU84J_12535, partial [Gammaproteobacteria bacterium]